jgi:hypothetical protein
MNSCPASLNFFPASLHHKCLQVYKLHCITRSAQKERQHIYFLGPVLLDINSILCAAAFKCPAFMDVVARFPAT